LSNGYPQRIEKDQLSTRSSTFRFHKPGVASLGMSKSAVRVVLSTTTTFEAWIVSPGLVWRLSDTTGFVPIYCVLAAVMEALNDSPCTAWLGMFK